MRCLIMSIAEPSLPALYRFFHQKVPSSESGLPNRTLVRSVALLAPRLPKCPSFSSRISAMSSGTQYLVNSEVL